MRDPTGKEWFITQNFEGAFDTGEEQITVLQ